MLPSLSSIVYIDFIVPKISGSFVISGGIYAGVQVYESGVFYIGKGYNQGYGSLIEFIFTPYNTNLRFHLPLFSKSR